MTDILFDETDLDHAENYCRHGRFIGNPYGADYMCGWCESGDEPLTEAEYDAATIARAERTYNDLVATLTSIEPTLPAKFPRVVLITIAIDAVADFGSAAQRAWNRQHA